MSKPVPPPSKSAPQGRGGKAVAPPPTRFGAQATQAKKTAQPAGKSSGGYKITVGSYLHQRVGKEALPPEIAGHSFVAIQAPGGSRQAWGFSPAGAVDVRKDFSRLKTGVRGQVHDDSSAFAKPGVRTQTFEVGAAEARAAMAKVTAYRANTPQFNLSNRQCSTFATDVLRAAKIDAFAGGGIRRPQQMHQQLLTPQAPRPKR
jgi:hypothetical protein